MISPITKWKDDIGAIKSIMNLEFDTLSPLREAAIATEKLMHHLGNSGHYFANEVIGKIPEDKALAIGNLYVMASKCAAPMCRSESVEEFLHWRGRMRHYTNEIYKASKRVR